MREIAKLISERRKQLKMTAQHAAELSGVSAQTVRAIEKGSNPPKLDTLARIFKALGVQTIVELKRKGAKTVRIAL